MSPERGPSFWEKFKAPRTGDQYAPTEEEVQETQRRLLETQQNYLAATAFLSEITPESFDDPEKRDQIMQSLAVIQKMERGTYGTVKDTDPVVASSLYSYVETGRDEELRQQAWHALTKMVFNQGYPDPHLRDLRQRMEDYQLETGSDMLTLPLPPRSDRPAVAEPSAESVASPEASPANPEPASQPVERPVVEAPNFGLNFFETLPPDVQAVLAPDWQTDATRAAELAAEKPLSYRSLNAIAVRLETVLENNKDLKNIQWAAAARAIRHFSSFLSRNRGEVEDPRALQNAQDIINAAWASAGGDEADDAYDNFVMQR